MACKRANFKTTFSIDKLTLAQADELYQKLLSLLSFDLKDRLAVEVQDCVGGRHDLFSGQAWRQAVMFARNVAALIVPIVPLGPFYSPRRRVLPMSKKKKTKPRTQLEVIKSIRNDWGQVHPSTKIFRDRRDKAEEKYPKQTREREFDE